MKEVKEAAALSLQVLSEAVNDMTFWKQLIHGVSTR